MKKLLTIFMFIFVLNAFGQSLKLDGVLQVRLRNTGEILGDDNQVKGYYYFYSVDKADKGNYNYILKLTDENLREINSINIVKSKYSFLIEAEYNGDAFAFLFYNSKEKMVEIISYDKNLKELGNAKKLVKGAYSTAFFNSVAMGNDPNHQFLVGVRNKGFLYYGFVETKKYHYSLDYYDNNLKAIWNSTTNPEDKAMLVAEDAFQTNELVGSTIMRKKNAMSKDASYDLMVHDLATGKERFKIELKDEAYNLSTAKITFDEVTNNIMVFGEYFELTDKEFKSNSLGYFYILLDLNGKVANKKFVSYGKDISRFVKVDESGKMDKGARIFVHEILRNADGDVFVIGEQFKKAASGFGIATAVLGGGRSQTSTAQLVVLNMVIFQFNKDLDIKGVHIFEKDKSTFLLPAGSEWLSAKMLAYMAKSYGWFDFAYFQFFKDKNTFLITYINYDKEKGEKAKNVLGMIVYTPEKTFTIEKMALNRKSTDYMVRKAKSGYIMVAEYFKKEKNLDVRLEKINY